MKMKIIHTRLYKYVSKAIVEDLRLPLDKEVDWISRPYLPNDRLVERLTLVYSSTNSYIYWLSYHNNTPFTQALLNWLKTVSIEELEKEFNSHELMELLQNEDQST